MHVTTIPVYVHQSSGYAGPQENNNSVAVSCRSAAEARDGIDGVIIVMRLVRIATFRKQGNVFTPETEH